MPKISSKKTIPKKKVNVKPPLSTSNYSVPNVSLETLINKIYEAKSTKDPLTPVKEKENVKMYVDLDVLKNKIPLDETCVGLEVEMEKCNVLSQEYKEKTLSLTYWNITNDSSLRDSGVELVFNSPYGGQDLISGLKELHSVVQKYNPVFSQRTSVHVHIDFRTVDINTILKFIVLYIILEKSLHKYIGGNRDQNIFCLPFYKADFHIVNTLVQHIYSAKNLNSVMLTKLCGSMTETRYAGLNLNSYFKYKSMEVRSCGGTGDVERILEWINILLSIKN